MVEGGGGGGGAGARRRRRAGGVGGGGGGGGGDRGQVGKREQDMVEKRRKGRLGLLLLSHSTDDPERLEPSFNLRLRTALSRIPPLISQEVKRTRVKEVRRRLLSSYRHGIQETLTRHAHEQRHRPSASELHHSEFY